MGDAFGFGGRLVGCFPPKQARQVLGSGSLWGGTGVGIRPQLRSKAEDFFFFFSFHAAACLRMLSMCFSSVNS